MFFSVFAMLGMSIYGVREVAIAKGDDKAIRKVISELLTLIFISVLVVALVFIVLLNSVDFFSVNKEFYYIAAINILSSAVNVDWVYQGLGRFQLLAMRAVL
jgi:O-antigen/teichoic acid export membrane protein